MQLQIRDRTENFIQPIHGILPVVTKIEKVQSLKFQVKFLETQRFDLINSMAPTQLLFHGTSDDGIRGIVKEGFRLPPEDKNNMFGQVCGHLAITFLMLQWLSHDKKVEI